MSLRSRSSATTCTSMVSCGLLWSAGTTAQVESDYGVTNNISIIAVDTANNESVPGTITVIH